MICAALFYFGMSNTHLLDYLRALYLHGDRIELAWPEKRPQLAHRVGFPYCREKEKWPTPNFDHTPPCQVTIPWLYNRSLVIPSEKSKNAPQNDPKMIPKRVKNQDEQCITFLSLLDPSWIGLEAILGPSWGRFW